MLVKACGLRTLKEITWAGDLGYDFFGIVVDPKSKRYVRPAELERLWASIPCEWRKRCVLVARKLKDILFCARFCREALLQCYEPFPAFVAARRRFQPVSGEEQWQWFQTQQMRLITFMMSVLVAVNGMVFQVGVATSRCCLSPVV